MTYTDCYSTSINEQVSLADFVLAFYTTPVFRLERIILKYLARAPSTDAEARLLAQGSIESFAAWRTEQRSEEQLLMCDVSGRTRSWFMVDQTQNGDQPGTLLRFGSAVVPKENRSTGELELGIGFSALLGFHRLYSIVLLSSARRRLGKVPH